MTQRDIKKAVILAAGYGTRRLPVTKTVPKEILPIADKPAIQYIAEEAVSSGIEEILIVLSRNKECIRRHFQKYYEQEEFLKLLNRAEELKAVSMDHIKAEITYVYQDEMNGSGAAIELCGDFAEGKPFAVLFGDDIIYNPQDPCISQLIRAYRKYGKIIVGVQAVPEKTARKCGVIDKGRTDGRATEIKSLIEKPPIEVPLASPLASLGRFILTPDIFGALKRAPRRKNEIYLTDAIDILSKEKGAYAYEFEGIRYDIGDRTGFIIANIEYGLRDCRISQDLREYLSRP